VYNGLNPFGSFVSSYSYWSVILAVYNLPSRIYMRPKFMFLSSVILSPNSSGQNLSTPPVVTMNPSDSIIHIVFYSCYSPLAKSCRIGFELLPLACLIYPTKVFYSGLIGYIVLWQRVVVYLTTFVSRTPHNGTSFTPCRQRKSQS
jgi:hypothetical protein